MCPMGCREDGYSRVGNGTRQREGVDVRLGVGMGVGGERCSSRRKDVNLKMASSWETDMRQGAIRLKVHDRKEVSLGHRNICF